MTGQNFRCVGFWISFTVFWISLAVLLFTGIVAFMTIMDPVCENAEEIQQHLVEHNYTSFNEFLEERRAKQRKAEAATSGPKYKIVRVDHRKPMEPSECLALFAIYRALFLATMVTAVASLVLFIVLACIGWEGEMKVKVQAEEDEELVTVSTDSSESGTH